MRYHRTKEKEDTTWINSLVWQTTLTLHNLPESEPAACLDSLNLFGDYFIHGGILPSYAASHGCIRMIYENAVFVYNWAKIGTPGEIINRTASKQKDVVPDEEGPDIKTLY
ncbi:MAG: L,D-transpeptidase [Syntrophobacteraceae bacterium]